MPYIDSKAVFLKNSIPPGFKLGTAQDYSSLSTDEKLQQLIVENFNLLTPSNSLKLARIGKNPDDWDFSQSDWIVDFAIKNNLAIRGHLMIWGYSIPDWMREMGRFQFSAMIKDYITQTMKRYPQITDWDIAGEAYNEEGDLKETLLSSHLGDNWMSRCFLWAKEARPDARLFYSEFRLQRPRKQESILSFIDSCQNEGVPLDGIAFQLHHNVAGTLKLFRLKEFIQKIQAKGLETPFSEVTLWNQSVPVTRVHHISQAVAYSELLRLALDCGINTFNIWGATDRYSWRFPEREPFLFDSEYQPKLAYHAIANQLAVRGVNAL